MRNKIGLPKSSNFILSRQRVYPNRQAQAAKNNSGRGFESLLIVALILPKSRTLREATFVRIFR